MELRNLKILKRIVRLRFPLERLPDELCLGVLEQMTIHDLSSASRTSKRTRALCNPVLYADVDISWHNRGWVDNGNPEPFKIKM